MDLVCVKSLGFWLSFVIEFSDAVFDQHCCLKGVR